MIASVERVAKEAARAKYDSIKKENAKDATNTNLINDVKLAAKEAANTTFFKLKEAAMTIEDKDTSFEIEHIEIIKADVEKAGFEAAKAEYARLKEAEEDVNISMSGSAKTEELVVDLNEEEEQQFLEKEQFQGRNSSSPEE